jgi:hypothetical protein
MTSVKMNYLGSLQDETNDIRVPRVPLGVHILPSRGRSYLISYQSPGGTSGDCIHAETRPNLTFDFSILPENLYFSTLFLFHDSGIC